MELLTNSISGGDHCKFGFPLAASLTILSWGGINYQTKYKNAGEFGVLQNTVKWGTDFILKAHTKTNELYIQVLSSTQAEGLKGL